MNEVCVLMSTYNGAKYLKEQIDSILNQKKVNVKLVIRDDGSKDSTLEIIKSYTQEHENISYEIGENLGPAKSFLELIKKSPNSEYYALSDQDDYWAEDKLCRAVELIQKQQLSDEPIVYHSNLIIADSNLTPCRVSQKKVSKNRYTCLVDNVITGCTIVMNKKMRDILYTNCPDSITMHDEWINIIASFFGKVVFDEKAYIFYRQHGDNSIGMRQEENRMNELVSGIHRLRRKDFRPRLRNATSFLSVFGNELSEKDYFEVKKMVDYRKSIIHKIKLLFDFKIRSFSLYKDLRYRILIWLGEV